jgi:hypothetical protein
MGRVQNTISALTAGGQGCPAENLSPGGALLGVATSPFDSTCPTPLALFGRPALADELALASTPGSALEDGGETDVGGELDWAATPALEVDDLEGGADVEPDPVTEPPPSTTNPEPPATTNPETPAPTSPPASAAPPSPPQEPPPAQQQPAQPPPPTTTTVLQSPPAVTAIGDSVMLGAAYTLAASIPGIDLDATVGRQADAAVGLLQQKAAAGVLGQVVVLQIGNNGTFTDAQFDRLMAAVGPDRKVVFVNLKVPRAWEAGNNAVIAAGVSRYANASLVDWATACATYQGLTISDGIHLTPAGATYYTQLVIAAMGG